MEQGRKVKIKCSQCQLLIERWQRHIDRSASKKFFCSLVCKNSFSKGKAHSLVETLVDVNCLDCGKLISNRRSVYCDNVCQNNLQYKENISRWKAGELLGYDASEQVCSWLKRYLIQKYDNRCSICGWCEVNPTTGKVPIQVEHIDGNFANNKEENLTLLCPNHHSLTSTYGALNKGKGRPKRRAKLQGNKIISLVDDISESML